VNDCSHTTGAGAVGASKSAAIPTTAYSVRLTNVSRPVYV